MFVLGLSLCTFNSAEGSVISSAIKLEANTYSGLPTPDKSNDDRQELLAENDNSTLLALDDSDFDLNTHIASSLNEAKECEQRGDTAAACVIYNKLYKRVDSLNKSEYISKIDSLRVIYWVDQIKIENAEANSAMQIEIVGGGMLIMLLAVYLSWWLRRKNRAIILSHKRLKQARQDASYSIQSKSIFLSNMSHELRTPLNAIVGFSGYLADNEEVDDEMKEQCADLIQQNSDLLIKLINDIVDLSDLNDRNITFKFELCDVVGLCRNVIDTVNKVKRTNAVVSYSTDLSTLTINTDPGRLQQVLINLLINATKFTQKGTIKLELNMSDSGRHAVFVVQDTGHGIPLDKQPHIFKRFEKLHEGVQGAGLGLSICKLIVENVGGEIWIDPTYTDGARFIFTHPIDFTPPE